MPDAVERALKLPGVITAQGAEPLFQAGDTVKVAVRFPVGHYRVPTYIRGKRARVEAVIVPAAINNEDEIRAKRCSQAPLLPHCHTDAGIVAAICGVTG